MQSRATRILIVAAALGLASIAKAQQQAPNPTDLRAAYCISLTKALLAEVQQSMPQMSKPLSPDAPPEIVQQHNAALEKMQSAMAAANARLNKLQLYLLPRMQYVDALGLVSADKSARDDLQRIESTGSKCIPQCPAGTGENCLRDCERRAMPDYDSVVNSSKAWATLDWLPY